MPKLYLPGLPCEAKSERRRLRGSLDEVGVRQRQCRSETSLFSHQGATTPFQYVRLWTQFGPKKTNWAFGGTTDSAAHDRLVVDV